MGQKYKYALQDRKMILFLERARIDLESSQKAIAASLKAVKEVEVALERRIAIEKEKDG